MSSKFNLPPPGHPVWTLIPPNFNIRGLTSAHVAQLPTLAEARRTALATLKGHHPGSIVHTLVRRIDGAVVLKTFGTAGGDRTRWNFGRPPYGPPLKAPEELADAS